LFWGLRKIKKTNKTNFSEEKLFVQIAIGVDSDGNENIYTSKRCEKFLSNNNFLEAKNQRFIIKLPVQDEYKPYLNIRCLSQNTIKDISTDFIKTLDMEKSLRNKRFFPALIGSFTVKSINKFYISEQEIENKYRNCMNQFFLFVKS